MPGRRRNPPVPHWLWVGLGFFCCALIALSGIIQIAHTHADATVQSDCALCHTAHLSVEPAVPQTLLHIMLVAAAIAAAFQLIRLSNFSTFSLFTRPPPDRALLL